MIPPFLYTVGEYGATLVQTYPEGTAAALSLLVAAMAWRTILGVMEGK